MTDRIQPVVLNYAKLYAPCALRIPEDFREQMALKKWSFEYVQKKTQAKFIPAWYRELL